VKKYSLAGTYIFHLLCSPQNSRKPEVLVGSLVKVEMEDFPQASVKTIRVGVADSTRMNSQLIVAALKRHSNFDVSAVPSNSTLAVRELQNLEPDVALVSARLEDGPLSGFNILERLRADESKCPAVILVDTIQRELVVDAFRAGARGVFCREEPLKSLPKCIRRVHERQFWLSNAGLEFLLELIIGSRPLKIRESKGITSLTAREKEIVHLVAKGLRNQDISSELKINEHTVRNHLFRIFDKLGVSSRVELVLYTSDSVRA
jgi:two-component system nitrate/nitrite response regulator NarL